MTQLAETNLEDLIASRSAEAADIRHRLHRIPELAFAEIETAAAIRARLDELQISHTDGVADAPTATIALIGDASKPCIALRADIDALPIQEQTNLSYASTRPGRMHACGHDGHTAILLATAAVLKSMADELSVCVKLIWQPAEEDSGGAGRLVKAGILDGAIGPKVCAIFGLHGWPGLPIGTVASKPGPLLAATDSFKATFLGNGCHAAFPHTGVDPIVAACEAVVNLQQFVAREMDPTEPAVVTVGIIKGGTATNIIPDQAIIEGTARTLNDASRARAKTSIARRCEHIAAAAGCSVQFDWRSGYPATVNDPAMTEYVAAVARRTFGPQAYVPVARPAMGGEDFAYYLEKVPGCFFLIGVEPPGGKTYPSLHSDRYDFSDAALSIGVRMFVGVARNFAP